MDFYMIPDDSLESFVYVDVQNLTVDHPLTPSEIEECKDFIFSKNNIQQIYFKDTCDLKSIEVIKNLLSISEYIDDSKIEKYVLLYLSKEERDLLTSSSFENPETWQVPYEYDNDSFSLTDIPRERVLKEFINNLVDNKLSCVEEIMKVYDKVKMFEYKTTDDIIKLPELVFEKKADSIWNE